ncbi:MAG: serine/threonine protein kinase [Spirochaetales bacterium]|nr:serine/threonine protein kinase [Spirochaetales bacterium]
MAEIKKWQTGEFINNRYEIISFLGKGGMGKTYLALDKETGKRVALKLLTFSDIDDWKVLELFEREIKTLAAIDHPLIPDYLDNFRIDDGNELYFVLVQEYIEGKTLLNLVKTGKRFTNSEVEEIFKSLLETVSYIHELHPPVIHRDINPKNIILADNGKVFLVDFGAVADPVKSNNASTIVGTIGYMPQEQLYGKIKPASDMYALAATMIFLLTGKEPSEFDLKNMRLDYHAEVDISGKIKTILDRMLDPDYKTRLSDAKKALDFLEGRENFQEAGSLQDSPDTEHVMINQTSEGYKEISFKKKKAIYFFLIFFAIAWNSILIGFITNFGEMEEIPVFIYLFMTPFFGAGIFMIGMILYGFFGNVTLLLTGDELRYKNTIFGFTFKSSSVSYHDIKGTKIIEERGSKGHVSYILKVFGSGQTIKIGQFQGLDRNDLDYLKDLIEKEVFC